jgi:hypothetical protein
MTITEIIDAGVRQADCKSIEGTPLKGTIDLENLIRVQPSKAAWDRTDSIGEFFLHQRREAK